MVFYLLKQLLCVSTDVLSEEGKLALEKLLKFMIHPAISSINLTTVLGSLATVARQRPMFMSEVVQAYETLHGGRFLHGFEFQFKANIYGQSVFEKRVMSACFYSNACVFHLLQQTFLPLWPSLRSAA